MKCFLFLFFSMTVGLVTLAHAEYEESLPATPSEDLDLPARVHPLQWAVAGYSVFFVDAGGDFESFYGLSETDRSGYFSISHVVYAGQSQPMPIFIEVVNSGHQVVYRSLHRRPRKRAIAQRMGEMF